MKKTKIKKGKKFKLKKDGVIIIEKTAEYNLLIESPDNVVIE